MTSKLGPQRQEGFLLDAIADPVTVQDKKLRIQWANRAAGKMLNEEPENLVGEYCYQAWHGQNRMCEICPVLWTIQTKEPQECELESHDGRHWLVRSYPLLSEGVLEGVTEFTLEITEKKIVEEERTRAAENQQILLDNIQTQIWYLMDERTYGTVNKAHAEFQGLTVEDMSFQDLYDLFPENVAEICRQGNIEVFSTGKPVLNEEWIPHVSGEWRLFSIQKTPKLRADGTVEYVVCSGEDITERKQVEETLRESEERFRTVLENLPGGIFAHDLNGRILLVNEQACKNTGYTRQELLRMTVYDIDPYAVSREDQSNLWHKLKTGQAATIESVHNKKDGNQYPTELHLNAITLSGQPCILPIAFDITERKQMEERLREMSLYDTLTGLYSRNFFEEEMKRLSDERHNPLGIIVCDLDGLKFINDTLGHQAGDQMLITIANILRQNARTSDIIARIGGDEFAILLTETDPTVVKLILQRLRQAVQDYNSSEPEIPLALSLGHALSERATADMQTLFREADNRMYREKIQHEGSARNAILQAITKTMQAKDFYIQGHCDRLQELAASLARSLNLSQDLIDKLYLFARFHDLGKVGVSDNILFKHGPLTEEEWRQMHHHCVIGHRIASSVPDLEHIADFILKHHEQWDGRGYPLGLSGRDIPLACRILAIVDAYDSMISDRPYRRAMTREEAVAELKNCAGTQFDPELVERFIELLQGSNKHFL